MVSDVTMRTGRFVLSSALVGSEEVPATNVPDTAARRVINSTSLQGSRDVLIAQLQVVQLIVRRHRHHRQAHADASNWRINTGAERQHLTHGGGEGDRVF